MIGPEEHNARARSATRILDGLDGVTLDQFADAVLDTRMIAAETMLPGLLAEYERLGSGGSSGRAAGRAGRGAAAPGTPRRRSTPRRRLSSYSGPEKTARTWRLWRRSSPASSATGAAGASPGARSIEPSDPTPPAAFPSTTTYLASPSREPRAGSARSSPTTPARPTRRSGTTADTATRSSRSSSSPRNPWRALSWFSGRAAIRTRRTTPTRPRSTLRRDSSRPGSLATRSRPTPSGSTDRGPTSLRISVVLSTGFRTRSSDRVLPWRHVLERDRRSIGGGGATRRRGRPGPLR